MKAAVYTEYGPPEVLKIAEVKTPSPGDNELLVKVRASSVNYGDLTARDVPRLTPAKFNMPTPMWPMVRLAFGVFRPRLRILGNEYAGVVEQVGAGVTRYRPGDEVFGYLGMRMGAYAEYLCVEETACVAPKPSAMTFEEAAVTPYGAMMAHALLSKVDPRPGQRILVNGASGGIGSAAVQLAKFHFGAEVTGVCGTPRMDFVKSLGASEVIDYTEGDFTRRAGTYDVIFDILGRSSFSRCRRCLKPDGRCLPASFKTRRVLQMLWTGLFGGKKVVCAFASDSAADLARVREMVEAGTIRAIVDKVFPLTDVAAAHRYVEEGRRKGQVAVSVAA